MNLGKIISITIILSLSLGLFFSIKTNIEKSNENIVYIEEKKNELIEKENELKAVENEIKKNSSTKALFYTSIDNLQKGTSGLELIIFSQKNTLEENNLLTELQPKIKPVTIPTINYWLDLFK